MAKHLLDRLADKFTVGDDCWEWTASVRRDGYGQVFSEGRPRLAHRVMYELMVGPIPDGLVVDHLCRVRHCVRPAHMDLTTNRENILRGVGASARNAAKTYCPAGHPYSEANTYITKTEWGTGRQCRICTLTAQRETYRAHK